MFRRYVLLSFLLLVLGDARAHPNADVPSSRVRRQNPQSGQLIDSIFNIPITAIRESAAAAQLFSPENTQTIDTVFKIPVSTLEAVGSLVKSAREQRLQNAESAQKARQEKRDRLLAVKEQKRRRKEEIQNQRLRLQESKRVARHYHKDPLGLNALSDLLVGHYAGGLFGHRPAPGGLHRGHGPSRGEHKIHGNRPQNSYAVHEEVNEDTSFPWHGLTAGLGSFFVARPSSTAIGIENKVAPKQRKQKIFKYPSGGADSPNKVVETGDNREDDPPLENKIAPRSGRVTFV